MMRYRVCFAVLVLALTVSAQDTPQNKGTGGQGDLTTGEPQVEGNPAPSPIVNSTEILAAVLNDLSSLDIFTRQFVRYIWIPPWRTGQFDDEAVRFTIDSCFNTMRRKTLPPVTYVRPDLLRFDLRFYVDVNDAVLLDLFVNAIDNTFIQDFRFYVVQQIEIAEVQEKFKFRRVLSEQKKIAQIISQEAEIKVGTNVVGTVRRGAKLVVTKEQNGWYWVEFGDTGGWVSANDVEIIVVADALIFNLHLLGFEDDAIQLLQDVELIPWVMTSDVFVSIAGSQIDGGTYYQLQIFQDANGNNLVDLDDILALIGAVDDNFDLQQRALMMYSLVTGKRRIVILTQGQQALVNTAGVWITLDRIDDNRDAGTDFLFNLIDAIAAGQEVIIEAPCGLHVFLAVDGVGNLVDFVPEDLASHPQPRPGSMPRGGGSGTSILVPFWSCIDCHCEQSGLLDFHNEFFRASRLDLLDDVALAQIEAELQFRVEDLYRLYGQNQMDRRMEIGRDDYEAVVKNAYGTTVAEVSKATVAILLDFKYDLVDPGRALAELGFTSNDPVNALRQLLPPVQIGIAALENPVAGFLKDGISVDRNGYVVEYPDLTFRIFAGGGYGGAQGY